MEWIRSVDDTNCSLDTDMARKTQKKKDIYEPLINRMQIQYLRKSFSFIIIIIGEAGYITIHLKQSISVSVFCSSLLTLLRGLPSILFILFFFLSLNFPHPSVRIALINGIVAVNNSVSLYRCQTAHILFLEELNDGSLLLLKTHNLPGVKVRKKKYYRRRVILSHYTI